MGQDKAKLLVDGEPQAERIARLLVDAGIPVTVCGRQPIAGCAFLKDAEEFSGPLVALSRFDPTKGFVFVVSCDLPGFDVEVVRALALQISDKGAAIPACEGRLQPLCALYRPESLAVAREIARGGERRVMRWIERLDYVTVTSLDPKWLSNVNTPADWENRRT